MKNGIPKYPKQPPLQKIKEGEDPIDVGSSLADFGKPKSVKKEIWDKLQELKERKDEQEIEAIKLRFFYKDCLNREMCPHCGIINSIQKNKSFWSLFSVTEYTCLSCTFRYIDKPVPNILL